MAKPKKTKTEEEQIVEQQEQEQPATKPKPEKTVKCAICGEQVSKSEAFSKHGRYYHLPCFEGRQKNNEQRLKLQQYVAKCIGVPTLPGSICIRIEGIKNENEHFTYGGMLWTIIYIVEVKELVVTADESGIGLIPYYYDIAKEYYTNRKEYEKYLDSLKEQSIDPFVIPVRVVKVTPPKQTKRLPEIIDISEI